MASRRDRPGPRGLLAPPLLLLLLPPLLLAPWPAAGHGGKYSREKNEPERPPQREPAAEFRMEKLNQLWDKAQRVSGGPHLPGGVRAPGAAGVASFRPALRSRLGDALRFLSGPLRGGVGGRGGPRGVASPVGRGRGGLGAGVWVEPRAASGRRTPGVALRARAAVRPGAAEPALGDRVGEPHVLPGVLSSLGGESWRSA